MKLSRVVFHRKSCRIFLMFPLLWFVLAIVIMVSWKLEVFNNIEDTRQSRGEFVYQQLARLDPGGQEGDDDIGNFQFAYIHENDDTNSIKIDGVKDTNNVGTGRAVSIAQALHAATSYLNVDDASDGDTSGSNVIKLYLLQELDLDEESADSVVFEDVEESSAESDTDSRLLRELHDNEMVWDEELNLRLQLLDDSETESGENRGKTQGHTAEEVIAGETSESKDGVEVHPGAEADEARSEGEHGQDDIPTEPDHDSSSEQTERSVSGDSHGGQADNTDVRPAENKEALRREDTARDSDVADHIPGEPGDETGVGAAGGKQEGLAPGDPEDAGIKYEERHLHKDNNQQNTHDLRQHFDAKNNSQVNVLQWHQREEHDKPPWPAIPVASTYGDKGKPVKISKGELAEKDRLRYDKGFQLHAFNQYVSDMISVTRSIPDLRDRECQRGTYPRTLPSTSVIIVFRNEGWTVLLRTLHTVLTRSPPHLLRQVILVDDDSDKDEFYFLKEPLEAYVKKKFDNVEIVRTPKREGLIRARLLGVQSALGEVVTFLDSHCEVNKGWLEPMLSRIGDGPNHVVMPIIDIIDKTSFAYRSGGSGSNPQIGGFSWDLMFEWDMVSERERARRTSNADPVRSPTMAGGLFAINREYFYQIGSYDKGMDVWGAENLEMSFRIWMCGGTLELIPCSRVGHIFRSKNPNLDATVGNVVSRNTQRLVEVWLDEYKEIYYDQIHRAPSQMESYGDISDRVKLRRDLGCRTFRWYMENIYPEKFSPIDSLKKGKLMSNIRTHVAPLCLTAEKGASQSYKNVAVRSCQTLTHDLYLSIQSELRDLSWCLDYSDVDSKLQFVECHRTQGSQKWMQEKSGAIRHVTSNKCLTMASKGAVEMKKCKSKPEQIWSWNPT